jgi:hypothetical protein
MKRIAMNLYKANFALLILTSVSFPLSAHQIPAASPIAILPPQHEHTQNKATSTITNQITKKDLGVYKMLSWHYPNKFTVWLNGNELAAGDSITVPDGSKVEVTYEYLWAGWWGSKTGKKQALFQTSPGSNHAIVFKDWQQGPERISITNAKRLTEEQSVRPLAPIKEQTVNSKRTSKIPSGIPAASVIPAA